MVKDVTHVLKLKLYQVFATGFPSMNKGTPQFTIARPTYIPYIRTNDWDPGSIALRGRRDILPDENCVHGHISHLRTVRVTNNSQEWNPALGMTSSVKFKKSRTIIKLSHTKKSFEHYGCSCVF